MGVDPTVNPSPMINCVLNVKAVVAAFNQEKALVGAFSVITNLRMELFQAQQITVRLVIISREMAPHSAPLHHTQRS